MSHYGNDDALSRTTSVSRRQGSTISRNQSLVGVFRPLFIIGFFFFLVPLFLSPSSSIIVQTPFALHPVALHLAPLFSLPFPDFFPLLVPSAYIFPFFQSDGILCPFSYIATHLPPFFQSQIRNTSLIFPALFLLSFSSPFLPPKTDQTKHCPS